MMKREEILISFKNVNKYFIKGGSIFKKKHLRAVNNVSFDMYKGEILAVVGESGCGKTTLARMITKLIEPTTGSIIIDGKDIAKGLNKAEEKDFRSKVQMIFQDPFGSLNPAHKLSYIVGRAIQMYNPGISSQEVFGRVASLFETVGLTPAEDYMEKHPSQISGGQRQRIVIARALAVNPTILVADEPTSMLDVSIGIEIMNLMLELKNKKDLTYMLITHNLASARYMADRIIVMYAGVCVEGGMIDEVIEGPLHPYTVLLLGSTPEPFREEKIVIEASEEAPDLTSNKPSCLFHNRCPYVMDKCRGSEPPMFEKGNRRVKCFLYEVNRDLSKPLVKISAYNKSVS